MTGSDRILRPARQGDFPAIKRLVRQVGINPLGLHWSRFLVVIDEHDHLLACGQVKPHRDGSRELASIAVHSSARGQGLARLVIERLLVEHLPPLYLTCRESVRFLYEKFGFRVIRYGEMPPYFRRISRFVNWLHRLGITPEAVLVMRLAPDNHYLS
jgi:N-acetylglutamate synthase-like GNAT family acetyltransferase